MFMATLIRGKSDMQGTFGVLTIFNGEGASLELQTIELPWKDNRRNVSCIPAGSYFCAQTQSKRFGLVYEVMGVPGRSGILIHAGNVAGDTEKGFKADVEGCLLVGMSRGELYGQKAVLESRHALKTLHEFTQGAQFELSVRWDEKC